ncbi:MAG: hypothetical protein JNL10_03905 [Verrucomicrobiales bacterium]|nr:hypothetical protein [Verrucomicrobiales bacterium]
MSSEDLLKLVILGPLFLGVAPLAGVAMKHRPVAQRWVFSAMCFMTINGFLAAGNWGLTLGSIESYRGHTKGYHFYFNHALALSLIAARLAEDGFRIGFLPPGIGWLFGTFGAIKGRRRTINPRIFRLAPPGLLAYLVYCAVSLLSIVNAPQPNLTLMAAHKMLFASVLMVASYNVLRTEADLQFFLKVMVVTLTWQLCVVLKMKYLDGMYQVRGTFEHQNPLAMYCVLIGMVFLATALGPPFPGSNWVLWGFLVTGVIVQCTLSRAALAMFAVGTVGILGLSVLEKPTLRRLGVTGFLGIVGVLGLLLSLDTIVARFNDHGNAASGELREVMNRACRQMAQDRALGIGWNNYALVVNPPYPYADIYYEWIRGRGMKVDETKANAVVESHYYLLLGETGKPALVMYLVLIAGGLWRNLRAVLYFPHSFLRCLALGIGTGCSLNYVQSLLERVLVQPRNLMLWMILFGISARLDVLRLAGVRPGGPDTGRRTL